MYAQVLHECRPVTEKPVALKALDRDGRLALKQDAIKGAGVLVMGS